MLKFLVRNLYMPQYDRFSRWMKDYDYIRISNTPKKKSVE